MTQDTEGAREDLWPGVRENDSEDGAETVESNSGDFVANRCGGRERVERLRVSVGFGRIIAAVARKIVSA